MSTRLPDWLAKRAALSGARVGLIHATRAYTFAEMDVWVRRTAGLLAQHGVRRGDRVALLIPNVSEYVWCVHALPRLGAVAVPLNLRLTEAEIAGQLAAAQVTCLVYHSTQGERAAGAVRACPSVRLLCIDEHLDARAAPPAEWIGTDFDLDDVHTIIFTSGTTGRPKGAMLTFGNHWWSAIGSALNLGLVPEDKWLACVPLFHVSGLSILMRSVIYGIPALLHERFDPAAVNQAIDEEGVTIVSVVATMLARMLDARGRRPYPPSLRCVLAGGGPVPRPLLERCRDAGVPVVQTYGLTETASQVATLAPHDALRKLGSAGRPLFPVELRIEADGRPAAPYEAGEILVRGPNVMKGYYGLPDETAQALRGGWLHTGDVGYLDEEGYLYVLDRRTDLIISGGENVYPAEVESVLLSHPAVAEAAVVGRPDETWGAVPVAVVKLREGSTATAEELIAFCRTRLAGYKTPKDVVFVPELPKSASGKLLRRAVREWVVRRG